MVKKTKNKSLKGKNILLILGIIYTLIFILAIISYVSKMNTISTTPVTLGSIIGVIWPQIVIIILFIITYILYNKAPVLGTLLEIIMGIAILVYIVISVATMGINILALLIELIYPLILVFHGLKEFKQLSRKGNKKMSTI